MNSLASLLDQHVRSHPELELQDAIKFLYQSCMGPSHLGLEPQAALDWLEAEWAGVEGAADAPPTEPLGSGLCRLSLAACKGQGLEPSTLAALFLETAQTVTPNRQELENSLKLLYNLPFPRSEVDQALADYRQAGMPAVHHSDRYRRAYAPAYRVVEQDLARLLPLLSAIDRHRRTHPQTLVALDGPCATGKTTLGGFLSRLYHCPLFHMDDFFLPPERKTAQRLAQPGGNVDAERFFMEVLSPLSQGKTVRYRPYRCHPGTLGEEVVVPPASLAVVEGVYSLRPDLHAYYHVTCFLEAPWATRRARLLERGGAEALDRFEKLWIPLEDAYFRAFPIRQSCDVVLSNA